MVNEYVGAFGLSEANDRALQALQKTTTIKRGDVYDAAISFARIVKKARGGRVQDHFNAQVAQVVSAIKDI